MSHTSVITGPERRRRWSEDQKLALVAAAFGPGGSVADVARRADICTSLLYRWRQLLRLPSAGPGFVPAVLSDVSDVSPSPILPGAVIHVVLASGSVSIAPHASPALVAAALGALR
jgi:transposase